MGSGTLIDFKIFKDPPAFILNITLLNVAITKQCFLVLENLDTCQLKSLRQNCKCWEKSTTVFSCQPIVGAKTNECQAP